MYRPNGIENKMEYDDNLKIQQHHEFIAAWNTRKNTEASKKLIHEGFLDLIYIEGNLNEIQGQRIQDQGNIHQRLNAFVWEWPPVCKTNVKDKLIKKNLLPYFLHQKSSLKLILSNYTVSGSCNLLLLLNAQISTFAGNYNCALLFEQMGCIEQFEYP